MKSIMFAYTCILTEKLYPIFETWGWQYHGLACFVASAPGQVAIIVGTMNSELYQQTLQEYIRVSVHELKLKRKKVMQQGNDPKHTSHMTKE